MIFLFFFNYFTHDVIYQLLFLNFKVFLTHSFLILLSFRSLCTPTGKSTGGVSSSISVCIVGESNDAVTTAGRNVACSSKTFRSSTRLGAGCARAYTKQEQGHAEMELLCREPVTGMENSLKNEHCPAVVLAEHRIDKEDEVRINYFIFAQNKCDFFPKK